MFIASRCPPFFSVMVLVLDMTLPMIMISILTVSFNHDDHCKNDNDCNKDDDTTVA